MSVPGHIAEELNARALQQAVWLSIYLAQTLGFDDIAHRLTAMHIEVTDRVAVFLPQ